VYLTWLKFNSQVQTKKNLKMKKAKKVTRIAYSDNLNQAKYDALHKIAKRCGSVRTEVWRSTLCLFDWCFKTAT
jgi:hypothetical protein